MTKTLSLYITKTFLKYMLYIFFGTFMLLFIVDFFEEFMDAQEIGISQLITLRMVLGRIPMQLQEFLQFIVLAASMFTFYRLSSTSETTVMQASGLSFAHMSCCLVAAAIVFGIMTFSIYNPLATKLNSYSERLDNIHFKKQSEDYMGSTGGIWLKQKNPDGDGEVIIRAGSTYKNTTVFENVILLYINNDGMLMRRLDAQKMALENGKIWIATDVKEYQEGKGSIFHKTIEIPTNLTRTFILKTIKNDYESVENVSFFELRTSIGDLKSSGFDPRKFEVSYYYLMVTPIIYTMMVFIGMYFGIIHNRSSKSILSIIYGILCGFGIFMFSSLVNQFTSSGKLSLFAGTGVVVLIYLTIISLMIMRKGSLSNVLIFGKRRPVPVFTDALPPGQCLISPPEELVCPNPRGKKQS